MRKEVEICQQARIVRGTGGAVCPVRDQVQEHNHDLKRRGEVLGRQPCLLPIAALVLGHPPCKRVVAFNADTPRVGLPAAPLSRSRKTKL
jgi:hypothetical protein